MKTKQILLGIIVGLFISIGFSACKAKCDCPRFSKTNTQTHTQKALI